MERIRDWNGVEIGAVRSRGGTLALLDPLSNLVRGGVSPWPASEITQKLHQSRQGRAFAPPDLEAAAARLGYYCDLQSINSEDSLTWSVFGPLAYASSEVRADFSGWLLRKLAIANGIQEGSHIWLWRRLPHPDTLTPGGPEIDFGIQTREVVVLGEAKWKSPVGRGQGVGGDKDQIAIRRDLLARHGSRLFPTARLFVILAVGPGDGLAAPHDEQVGEARILTRSLDWKALCSCPAHPGAQELGRYLDWKTVTSGGKPQVNSREGIYRSLAEQEAWNSYRCPHQLFVVAHPTPCENGLSGRGLRDGGSFERARLRPE